MTRRVRRMLTAVRLFLLVQARSYFPHVYFALALWTIAMFRFVVPDQYTAIFLPALLLGEYGSVGVLLVTALRYLEVIEQSNVALIVTPLESFEYVVGMNVAAALIATAAGVVVFGGIVGVDVRMVWMIPHLALTASLAGLVGLAIAASVRQFIDAVVVMIPAILVYSLPMASWFELVPRWVFIWLPTDAALYGFANLVAEQPNLGLYLLYLIELTIFNALGYWWTGRIYRLRAHLHLEGFA